MAPNGFINPNNFFHCNQLEPVKQRNRLDFQEYPRKMFQISEFCCCISLKIGTVIIVLFEITLGVFDAILEIMELLGPKKDNELFSGISILFSVLLIAASYRVLQGVSEVSLAGMIVVFILNIQSLFQHNPQKLRFWIILHNILLVFLFILIVGIFIVEMTYGEKDLPHMEGLISTKELYGNEFAFIFIFGKNFW